MIFFLEKNPTRISSFEGRHFVRLYGVLHEQRTLGKTPPKHIANILADLSGYKTAVYGGV